MIITISSHVMERINVIMPSDYLSALVSDYNTHMVCLFQFVHCKHYLFHVFPSIREKHCSPRIEHNVFTRFTVVNAHIPHI